MANFVPAVSDLGRFRNSKGKAATVVPEKFAYSVVEISGRHYSLHILVCTAFHGKRPSAGSNVLHKDGNPRNNTAANLEWVRGPLPPDLLAAASTKPRGRKKKKPVRGRKKNTKAAWTVYASMSEAAKKLGVCQGNISSVVMGKLAHTGGYEFVKGESEEPLPGEHWKKLYWLPAAKGLVERARGRLPGAWSDMEEAERTEYRDWKLLNGYP